MMPRHAALLIAALLAACSEPQSRVADSALQELQTRLPGRYDNSAQVRADLRSGAAQPQPPVDLLIVPANAALIGKSVFYVRESVSGDPNRVLSQYVWVFGRVIEVHGTDRKSADAGNRTPEEHGGYLEQHIYVFKEPQRWLRAGKEPEMLQGMLPEDLQRLTGCELLWTRAENGFSAARSSHSCDPESRSEGQLIEQRIELRDTKLSLLEQQITPEGLVAAPAGSSDAYYRFVRRGTSD